MTAVPSAGPPCAPVGGRAARRTPVIVAALLVAAAVAVAGLLWAKWLPYASRAATVSGSHRWSGSDIFAAGGVSAGDAPSWHAAVSFAGDYLAAVWKALAAALLISAAVQALVPAGWAARALNRRSRVTSAAVGGLAGTPSMMCTCCTAPVASTLRRAGVGTAGVVAYWLGNPLLNPAVLVFLGFVAPWQWTVTRLVVGVLVVVAGSALVARLSGRTDAAPEPDAPVRPADETVPLDGRWLAAAPGRFVRALARLVLVLVPEYVVVVLLVGGLRGWLFPLGSGGALRSGILVVVVAAAVGTLLVIPTAGEIPIVQGLVLAGLSLGGAGALLLTLPAVSLPGAAMMRRALGWRSLAVTAGVVAVGGLAAGVLLTVLG